MDETIKYAVHCGNGAILIDIINNRPYTCDSLRDPRVLLHDTLDQAKVTIEQVRRLGYQAKYVQLHTPA